MRNIFFTLFLILQTPSIGWAQDWQFVDVFPPTDLQDVNVNARRPMYGAAVDRNGRVWLMPHSSLDTLRNNGIDVLVRGIRVYNPDGSEAAFSPVTHFLYNGEPDTLKVDQGYGNLTAAGMTADQNGDILAAFNNKLYRFNADNGQPIHRYISPLMRTETFPHYFTKPAVTNDGYVVITFIFGGSPIVILNPELLLINTVEYAKTGFSRTIEVSSDGSRVFYPAFSEKRIFIYESGSGITGSFAVTDTINGPAVESMTRHPITGDIWFSGGSANDMPMEDSGFESFAYYSLNQSSGDVTWRFAWDLDVAWQFDPRPRGIGFTPNGKTAYAVAFGSVAPSVQKFTQSSSTQTTPDQFLISTLEQHSNLNVNLEVIRDVSFGSWISFGATVNGNLMLIASIQDNGPNDGDPTPGKVRRQLPMSFFPEEGTYEIKAYQTNFSVTDSDALAQLDPAFSINRTLTVLPPKTFGDVDNDNMLSPVDVAYLLQFIVELRPFSNAQREVSDVNLDNKINSMDASYMLQKILTPDTFCMPIEPSCTPKVTGHNGSFVWNKLSIDGIEYLGLILNNTRNVLSLELEATSNASIPKDWLVGLEGWTAAVNNENKSLKFATAGALAADDGPILLIPIRSFLAANNSFQINSLSINGDKVAIPLIPDYLLNTDSDPDIPVSFSIEPNFPNPFNPTTEIRFNLPEPADITLRLYDVMGRLVMEYPRQKFEIGRHSYTLDATGLSSGIYIYHMLAGKFAGSGKITLVK